MDNWKELGTQMQLCSKCKGGGYLTYLAPSLGEIYLIPENCSACRGVGFFSSPKRNSKAGEKE